MSANFTPNQNDYKNLTPFKCWLLHQINNWGLNNFPFVESDFDELTNYGMMMKLMKALNDVISNQNEVEQDVTNLFGAFTELQTYVNNYFDNLDVQDEVDNKLDEMVESGQLQEIIATYLNSKAVFGFDNVASMKSAENLIDGSYAKTLGFHIKNDGGSATYKIRNITNQDVVDEMKIISLSNNNLIAEYINEENVINVKKFGVKGDGISDDTQLIQKIIDDNPLSTIYFPESTYIISSPILTPANHQKIVKIEMDKYTILKASSNFNGDYVVKLGGKDNASQSLYDTKIYGIDGGIIDCNEVCGGIYVYGISPSVTNITILNAHTNGIFIPSGMTNGSADAYISNVKIYGDSSINSVGIDCTALDNTIEDIRIYRTQIGIKLNNGGNYLRNIHCLYSNSNLTDYESSIAFYIHGWNNSLYQCYSDQYSTGYYIDGNYRNYFYSPIVFYWNNNEYTHTAFYCNGIFNSFIDNLWTEFNGTNGTNIVLKLINKNSPEGKITNLHLSNVNQLTMSDEECFNPRYNYDLIKLNTNDITTSNSITRNNTVGTSGLINCELRVTGLTISANSSTLILTLPDGFKPKASTNVLIFDSHNKQYVNVSAWINANGQLYFDPKINITSDMELIVSATYNVN